MQWELALEFCLSAGPHRVEQSRPARNAGAAKQARHLGAKIGVLPAHRRVGCSAVLRCGDNVLVLVAKDL